MDTIFLNKTQPSPGMKRLLASAIAILLIVGWMQAQNITGVEYFFNDDPGFGSGTIVGVGTPSPELSNFNFDVGVGALQDGVHTLFVRVKDEDGKWSATNQRLFFKNSFILSSPPDITHMEHFFDTDPGFGMGTPLAFTPVGEDVSENYAIDITALSNGLHTLFVRTKTSEGIWSQTLHRTFFKDSFVAQPLPDITHMEYFLNTDPGFGLGTSIPFSPEGTDVSGIYAIDITSLPNGLHTLFVRTKTSEGIWSQTLHRTFFKDSFVAQPLYDITYMEYFFDTDPGLGLATQMPFSPQGSDVTASHAIDISHLSEGLHALFVRVKNSYGNWSITSHHAFFKSSFIAPPASDITYLEYFIDTDPGFGQGTALAFSTTGTDVDKSFTIDVSSVSTGFHTLYIRAMDADGRWSITNMHYFMKQTLRDLPPDVVKVEYFVNDDPGFGSGTILEIPAPADHIEDFSFLVDVSNLLIGNHMLFVRALDQDGNWGHTNSFEYCKAPVPGFETNEVYAGVPTQFINTSTSTNEFTQFNWDVNNDGIIDYTGGSNFQHTYPGAGVYQAKLSVISQEGCSDSLILNVYVYDCLLPADLVAVDITTSTAVLQWTPANIEPAWNIEYGLKNFIPGTGTTILNVLTNSYLLTSLASGVEYDFYVQSVCSGEDESSWAGPATFTTLEGEPCENPSDGGSIAASQTICSGSYPDPFTSITPASGFIGDLQYQWQISDDNITFIDIMGANSESYTHMSIITNTMWFRRLARVSCKPDWTGAAETNVLQIDVEPSGHYRSKSSGNWNDLTTWEFFNGIQWVDAVDYPGENPDSCPNPVATILNSHTVTVTANLSFGNIVVNGGGTLVVINNILLNLPTATSLTVHGSLVMHPTAIVNGAGNFTLSSGCTLYVGSVHGINIDGVLGNIQVSGSIVYGAGVHYIYNGGANQVTGDGIAQYIPASITINNPGFTVTLSVSITISGSFSIIQGSFDANNFDISLGGSWICTGTFIYGTSTVYFNSVGNVFVDGGNFYHVVFGGSGTVTATGSLIFYGNVTISYYFAAGSFTHTVYGSWVVTGTFVYDTSTIYFVCSDDVDIAGGSFYNVVFAGSGTITATASFTIYGNFTITGYFIAGSYTHYIYGNWVNNGTFIYGNSTIYFACVGDVYINTSSFYNIVFGGTGTVTATGPLNFYGNVTIENHFDAGAYTHVVYGNWTVTGVFVYGTSTIDFHGSGNALIGSSSFYNVIFCGTGTNTATGSLTFYGNVNITWHFDAGSFTHYVYGNWTLTGVFIHGTSTIDFHGSGNALIGSSNFYNVIFCGTGTNTATGSLTIYGYVNITWHFNAGSFTHYVYGNWTLTGVFIHGTSTIDFQGSGNAMIGSSNFYNVCFCGSGTITATGSLIFYGNVDIQWHFNAGSFTHYVYGNWTLTGVFIHGTSTIDFHGSGNALIGSSNFYNVIFCGTGTNTATGSLTIYGYVNITWHFDAGSFTHYVYGNWTLTGVFIHGTSTIDFHGSGNALIGSSNFYNVIFCGTGTNTATGSLTIYGYVNITWHFNAGSFTHYVYGNWTLSGVFIHGTSTIDFHGSDNALIGSSNFYNVIFCGTGTNTAAGSLTIYGNVLITWHFNAGSFVHYVYGNWVNNAVFAWGTSTIHFMGTVVQIIGGSTQTEFHGFVVNCSGGITLQQNITVNFTITLTLGIINAGSYTVTVVPAATLTGGSDDCYISGRLIRGFTASGLKFFPVGKGGFYRPLSYNCLTLTGTSMVEVELILTIIPGTIPSNISTVNRYWAVNQTGGSGITFQLTCNDGEIMPCCYVRMLQSDGTDVIVHNTTAPDYTNEVAFTAFGSFSLGVEPCIEPGIPTLSADVSICPEGDVNLEVLSGNLNDAEEWVWYADECGQNQVGTGSQINVSPESTTTYYVRGESSCIVTGDCASVTVTVDPLPLVQCPDGFCITPDEDPFILSGANPVGGIYSGKGVYQNQSAQYVFSSSIAREGSHVISYTYTDPVTGCINSCLFVITVGHIPYNLDVEDHTIPAMTDTCFNACNTIMVENVVAEPASIARFIAGQRVMLKPGVHFMAGSDVNVFISTNGIFCEDIPLVAVQEESKLAESTDSNGDAGFTSAGTDNTFRVYPNPTTGIFTLEFDNLPDGAHSIQVFGSMGNQILIYGLKGENRYVIDLTKFPPGLYYVRLINDSEHEIVRIIKQ